MPFRYDLNQIAYENTVEVINRFKGLNLIDRVPEELWTEVCNIVQEAVIKTINSLALSFLHSPTLTSIHDHWKNNSLD